MKHIYNDGGRAAAGYKGSAGDCVCRSIAIASGLPYKTIYQRLAEETANQRASKRTKKRSRSARDGINTKRKWFREFMRDLGFRWVSCMNIGSGCKIHLADGELPMGRLAVRVSRHYTAVINGIIHDTFDPQRDESWIIEPGGKQTKIGGRCVYGYWILDQ
jgi:hypothetical protein